MTDKTLREYIDIINEAQQEDTLDESEEELDEQFISRAIPSDSNPKPRQAKAKVEQVIRNA